MTIEFPTSYPYSLYDLGSSCTVSGLGPLSECKVGGTKRIDIFNNGEPLSPSSEVIIEVESLNTPNVDVSGMAFTITSYYDDNIYL